MRFLTSLFRWLVGGARSGVPQPGDRVVVISRLAPLRREDDTVIAVCGDMFTVRAVRSSWFGTELDVDGEAPGVILSDDVMPLDRALEHFAAALQHNPRNVSVLHGRARVWAALGEHERARTDQLEADRVGRADEEAERTKAMATLTSEIADDPTSALHYLTRGDDWRQRGELDHAIADYTEAIRLDPDFGNAYINRGIAWKQKGDLDRALADFDVVIRLAPEGALGYLNRGFVWLEKGDEGRAQTDLDEAIRREPRFGRAWSGRARLWLKRGELDRALSDCEEALRLEPDAVPTIMLRAELWSLKGELDRAIADCDRAMQLDQANASADTASRGTLRSQKNDHAGAITDFESALELDPENVSAMNSLAWLLATAPEAEFRNGHRAVEVATRALELTGDDNAAVLDTLACAYAEVGDFEAAIRWQTRAAEVTPEHFRELIEAHLELFRAGRPHRQEKRTG